ncbi:hypothetical protein PS691_02711 [Pseudomonas fluorescens]|uniref:Lipoprotein n=2 Tax=Pseudomonas fluorescens TaxID=294 RepID=A0A5E7CBL7_PSEFL|nr:hypothetical protein PS691_02711 [Pseudomonas fluorescens]
MKYALCAALLLTLSGCVTMSGDYEVTVQDASGVPIKKLGKYIAHGHNIYPIRNAFCLNAPGGTVIIRDIATGKELSGESPYHCR